MNTLLDSKFYIWIFDASKFIFLPNGILSASGRFWQSFHESHAKWRDRNAPLSRKPKYSCQKQTVLKNNLREAYRENKNVSFSFENSVHPKTKYILGVINYIFTVKCQFTLVKVQSSRIYNLGDNSWVAKMWVSKSWCK